MAYSLLLFKLQLYKTKIGVIESVNVIITKSFGNYIS